MRRFVIGIIALLVVAGCSGSRKSSLLLERPTRGPLEESPMVGHRVNWKLEPVMQAKAQNGVEVTVNYASYEFLNNFFKNPKVFGEAAGKNPFYPEHFVFYVNITNKSGHKIKIDPMEFALVDDRGNQLSAIGVDYVTAFADFRQPVSTVTRGMLDEARPGYFGIGLPIGKILRKSQWRFAMLKQTALQSGYLHAGVSHDGLITFWSPHPDAKQLHLIMSNIKTDFSPNDEAKAAADFVFDFNVAQ